MKIIKLLHGKKVKVDDTDYKFLVNFSWREHISLSGVTYAITTAFGRNILMHRLILEIDNNNIIDHIDGDGLNNCKNNLRICSHKENIRNRRKRKKTSSIYKGVSWKKDAKKWEANIKLNGKTKYLGKFKKEEDAAMAYDKAAKFNFKEFSLTNF